MASSYLKIVFLQKSGLNPPLNCKLRVSSMDKLFKYDVNGEKIYRGEKAKFKKNLGKLSAKISTLFTPML